MKTELITTRIYLQQAAGSLHIAYWTADEYHIKSSRDSLARALCGPNQEPSLEITEIVERIISLGGSK